MADMLDRVTWWEIPVAEDTGVEDGLALLDGLDAALERRFLMARRAAAAGRA